MNKQAIYYADEKQPNTVIVHCGANASKGARAAAKRGDIILDPYAIAGAWGIEYRPRTNDANSLLITRSIDNTLHSARKLRERFTIHVVNPYPHPAVIQNYLDRGYKVLGYRR